jgi:hypothetical protein
MRVGNARVCYSASIKITFAVGVTIAISLFTHVLFELPMKRILTRALLRRPNVERFSAIGPAGRSRSAAVLA